MATTGDRLRTRASNQQKPIPYTFTTYSGYESTGDGVAVGVRKEMSDVVTSDFRKRSASGEVIMNRMSSRVSTIASGMLSNLYAMSNPGAVPEQWVRDTGNLAHIACAWGGTQWGTARYSLVSPNDASSLAREVCTRTLNQIGRSDAQNWENLAEIRQTIAMLRHPLNSFFKWHNRTSGRGSNRETRTVMSPAESAIASWLAYRYGVRPVMQSVDATLRQLWDLLTKGNRTLRVTSRASGTIDARSSDTFVTNTINDGTWKYTVARQRTESLTVRAMSVDAMTFDEFSSLGLTGKELTTLPWELITLSFVVDWFVNVGDYLGALSQAFHPQSLGQCYVYKTVYSEYRETIAQEPWGGSYGIVTPRYGWVREDIIYQDRYPGLLSPGLVVKSDFRLDEITRLADGFALAAQAIVRKFAPVRRFLRT